MKTKYTGSYQQYRDAVGEAFHRSMHNPSVHWAPGQGFFATPDARLVPMNGGEMEIDCASYDGEGHRSMTGSRREYSDVRFAVRLVLAGIERSPGDAMIEIQCARQSEEESSAGYAPLDDLKRRLVDAERLLQAAA